MLHLEYAVHRWDVRKAENPAQTTADSKPHRRSPRPHQTKVQLPWLRDSASHALGRRLGWLTFSPDVPSPSLWKVLQSYSASCPGAVSIWETSATRIRILQADLGKGKRNSEVVSEDSSQESGFKLWFQVTCCTQFPPARCLVPKDGTCQALPLPPDAHQDPPSLLILSVSTRRASAQSSSVHAQSKAASRRQSLQQLWNKSVGGDSKYSQGNLSDKVILNTL